MGCLAAGSLGWVRRRIEPTRVTRGSVSEAHTGPVSRSASQTMLRNLYIRKVRPQKPTRTCENSTDPRLSSAMASAMRQRTGRPAVRTTRAKVTSRIRFGAGVSHLLRSLGWDGAICTSRRREGKTPCAFLFESPVSLGDSSNGALATTASLFALSTMGGSHQTCEKVNQADLRAAAAPDYGKKLEKLARCGY